LPGDAAVYGQRARDEEKYRRVCELERDVARIERREDKQGARCQDKVAYGLGADVIACGLGDGVALGIDDLQRGLGVFPGRCIVGHELSSIWLTHGAFAKESTFTFSENHATLEADNRSLGALK